MGIVNNVLAGASGNQGYFLTRSLRFRASASAYLSRTPASAGNRRNWTWSSWVKRGALGGDRVLYGAWSGSQRGAIKFTTNNEIQYYDFDGASVPFATTTTSVYQDVSAWYHVVVTANTSSSSMLFYVNGVLIHSASPSLNYDTYINRNIAHGIGYDNNGFFDGYLAEVNFIDGQSLTPSSFGMNSPSTGVWQPRKYTGTYGTNGFYLPFTDNSNNTATTIGRDFSGNGNNWTPINISVTAGATYDSMTDVPTLTSSTAANYAVINPLAVTAANSTITNGNLQVVTPNVGGNAFATFEIPISGKWYFEVTPTSGSGNAYIGVSAYTVGSTYLWQNTNHVFYTGGGLRSVDGSTSAYGASYADNDVIGVACDSVAGTITFYKNNVSQGSISHTMAAMIPALTDGASASGVTYQTNFGQRPFAYTPPSGFVALNTFNLPTPTIGATSTTQANKYFDISLWTGNGATGQTITNSGGLQPDFVWVKSRSNAYDNGLQDVVRGATRDLNSNNIDAEEIRASSITAFTSTGFTVGNDVIYNGSGSTYVGWQWNAGGSNATNTSGTITSTVRANTTAGFSIVTYTGNGGSGSTVGHGLGVAPRFIIIKQRNGSPLYNWNAYHASLGNTQYIALNTTDAAATGALFNNTSPTSSVFSLGSSTGSWNVVNNTNGTNYVAYCFSQIAGYSAFGTWTNNNSTNGTFTYLGFRPRFIMLKNTDNVERWFIFDSARQTFNIPPPSTSWLVPNSSAAEGVNGANTATIDLLSNGFKIYTTNPAAGEVSFGTRTYIYAAFAESPFKYALAR